MQKLQKITSKGQITLPVAWRNMVKTSAILVSQEGETLRISPARFEYHEKEYTVFDAIRDNGGKGIPATDVVRILKKLNDVA
jgi:bifunctional DNA-binding transcriptional regulator/antitoxin component of YhaV-PrlF toxin-antitoxin module